MTAQNPYRELDDERYEALLREPHVKSSYSNANGGCVMLASDGQFISIQDDKLPEAERRSRAQVYTRTELRAFIDGAKAGEFDHLA
ncbi:protein of unknown function [Actinopolyspora lacussalsi subsp. righensis]|uniref:DUF397 domain-containing protein n=1 Tax=Actinopolyspora righensis TaxID=995060 RepID=A0A1I6XY60_9ACTN|nr:DUF397 domain-containing protein [Actinopolyspora righensis]SFT42952.1 protein of unknown function [Actinopolyspora righensis]